MKKNFIYGGHIIFTSPKRKNLSVPFANIHNATEIIETRMADGAWTDYLLIGDLWDGEKFITVQLPG